MTCQTSDTLPPTLAKNPIIPLRLIGYLQPQPVGPFLDPQGLPVWQTPGPPNRQHQLVARSLVKNTGGVFIFTKPPSQKQKKTWKKKITKKTNKKNHQARKKILWSSHICLFGCSPFLCWRMWCSQQPAPSTALALGASVHDNDTRGWHPIFDTFQMPRKF